MGGYCDFNPKLFRPFTSKLKKIVPAMSDDWEIINESFRSDDGLGIGSAKLNSEIHDIPVHRFLRFCKEENITIISNVLQGKFIVGNDRSIYTQETYGTWKAKFDVRTEVIIPAKDYKVGHKYKTPCGMEVVYLGWKFMSVVKKPQDSLAVVSKITKRHFIVNHNTADILRQKFTKDLGMELTKAESEQKLNVYLNKNRNIAYFEDVNLNNPIYDYVLCKDQQSPLTVRIGIQHYVHRYKWNGIEVKDGKVDKYWLYEVLPDLTVRSLTQHHYSFESDSMMIDGQYRMGVT